MFFTNPFFFVRVMFKDFLQFEKQILQSFLNTKGVLLTKLVLMGGVNLDSTHLFVKS